jgi:hypothetical protein
MLSDLSGAVACHGLSAVFTDIFTAGDGGEASVIDLARFPWLEGKTFAELSALFIDSVVLGWMTEEDGKWSTDMCPPPQAKAVKGMKLAVLAQSPSVRVLRTPIKWEASGKAPDGKSCVSLARSQVRHRSFLLNVSCILSLTPTHLVQVGRLVHTGLGSSSLIAHVLQYPPPPPANSFVIGTAVINTHVLLYEPASQPASQPASKRERERERELY